MQSSAFAVALSTVLVLVGGMTACSDGSSSGGNGATSSGGGTNSGSTCSLTLSGEFQGTFSCGVASYAAEGQGGPSMVLVTKEKDPALAAIGVSGLFSQWGLKPGTTEFTPGKYTLADVLAGGVTLQTVDKKLWSAASINGSATGGASATLVIDSVVPAGPISTLHGTLSATLQRAESSKDAGAAGMVEVKATF